MSSSQQAQHRPGLIIEVADAVAGSMLVFTAMAGWVFKFFFEGFVKIF